MVFTHDQLVILDLLDGSTVFVIFLIKVKLFFYYP